MSTEYVCEVSGRVYKTARGARESAKRERLREYQRSYVRLNASTAQEFLDLMAEKAKEFYGWDMSLELENSCFDFWQTKKEKLEDKVLTVTANMRLSIEKIRRTNKDLCRTIPEYFEGVYISYTWVKVKYFIAPGAEKKLKFELCLGSFPKLLENYREYLNQQAVYFKYMDKKRKACTDVRDFLDSRPDYQEEKERESEILELLDSQRKRIESLSKYYQEGYMRLWMCTNGEAPEVEKGLLDTFS